MEMVADFFENCSQSFSFTFQLFEQVLAAPLKLSPDCPGPSQPRQRHPCQEGWPVALLGPIFALKRRGQGIATTSGSGEDAALGTLVRFIVDLGRSHEAEA